MTIEEAEMLMNQKAYDHLNEIISVKPVIDMSKKSNNDILMQAFCKAVSDNIIDSAGLDDKLLKLLNSSTNSISQNKLKYLMEVINKTQPDIKCVIYITTYDMREIIFELTYCKPDDVDFLYILKWLLEKFEITPICIRNKMSDTLKPTIVNNISQTVSRVLNNNTNDLVISISTISRIVNCYDHLIYAKFEK